MNQHIFETQVKQSEEEAKQRFPQIDPNGNRGSVPGDNSEFKGLVNPAAPRAEPKDQLRNYRDNTKLWPWPLGNRADELKDPEDEVEF